MKRLLLPLLLTGVAAAGGACCGSGAAQREETYYEKHVAFGDVFFVVGLLPPCGSGAAARSARGSYACQQQRQ